MPGPSPTPTLIKPDLRRRLQLRYEDAKHMSTRAIPDRQQIHALLAECLRIDPGNILYLDALLANLRHIGAPPRKTWLARCGEWLRGARKARQATPSSAAGGNEAESAEMAALRGAPEKLRKSLGNAVVVRQLAEMAGSCDLDEVEERYWQVAAEAAPQDAEIARGRARALCRRGKFGEGAAVWQTVLSLQAGDEEATTALSDLLPPTDQADDPKPLWKAWKDEPHNAEAGMRLADALIRGGQFQEAERVLTDLQSAAGADLQVLEKRETLQMARSENRLAIARRRRGHDRHRKAGSLVAHLGAEQQRLELDVFNLRCERLPRDWQIRLEFARSLKRAGNYSGAIQRLAEGLRLKLDEPSLLIELGECWQHLRQFPRAMEFYEKAAAKARSVESGGESHKLANYRLAVLAMAMGQMGYARERLRIILSSDAHFKDARQRLDKLEAN